MDEKEYMVVGFTGTRDGLTGRQRQELERILRKLKYHKFRHGDCVGADAQAHEIVERIRAERVAEGHGKSYLDGHIDIFVHPCNLSNQRAYKSGNVVYAPLPPLDRNKVIVDMSTVLIACPNGPEKLRSGTWSTVRYARKVDRVLILIMPDGRSDLSWL